MKTNKNKIKKNTRKMTSIYNIHYLKHRKPELNDDDTYIYLVNEPVKKTNKIDHILNSQYKKKKMARVFSVYAAEIPLSRFDYFPRNSNKKPIKI